LKDYINDRNVLITGGTNGIGLAAARQLACMGARVTISGRNAEKCFRVASELSNESGNKVGFITADLSTLAGVHLLAEEYKSKNDSLDVLVNNAGAYFVRRWLTADGYEMTFALNHLSYFLLTNLLLDMLKASAPSRVINVSSDAHQGGRLNMQNLQGQGLFVGFQAYARSKLANLLFTYELARRLNGCKVTVNALHPGFVHSGFTLNNGIPFRWFSGTFSRLFGRSPEKGAETIIYLATSPKVEGVTGKYYFDCQPIPSSRLSYDEELARQLWQVSLEMTGMEKEQINE
jgi:NAD(P)-dependent dehydrogenase (short-subunit alcohol dehydrogenase family)